MATKSETVYCMECAEPLRRRWALEKDGDEVKQSPRYYSTVDGRRVHECPTCGEYLSLIGVTTDRAAVEVPIRPFDADAPYRTYSVAELLGVNYDDFLKEHEPLELGRYLAANPPSYKQLFICVVNNAQAELERRQRNMNKPQAPKLPRLDPGQRLRFVEELLEHFAFEQYMCAMKVPGARRIELFWRDADGELAPVDKGLEEIRAEGAAWK